MEWIRTKDNLPSEGHNVLVYYENQEDVTIGRRWNDHLDKNGYHWKLEGRDEEYDTDEITHWMPLPEPPIK